MLSKSCLQCSQTIIKPLFESLRAWHTRHKFCSRSCAAKFHQRLTPYQFRRGAKAPNPIRTGQHLSPATQFRKGQRPWNKGIRYTQVAGAKNRNWKGGVTKLQHKIRKLPEYVSWKNEVFKRDNWTCRCGKRGGALHAHHIKAFSVILKEYRIDSVEKALTCKLLWATRNGQTLCLVCHKQTDSYLNPSIN